MDRDVKWLRECKFRSKKGKSGLAHKIAQESDCADLQIHVLSHTPGAFPCDRNNKPSRPGMHDPNASMSHTQSVHSMHSSDFCQSSEITCLI